ncbi:hypothetical protein Tsubulata_049849 [Turnera subulata]|uniref:Uncharacterized protein n=1 Tax=Turnera subulata TaxID=218843 RepID=A0A9Q0EZ66_9ROSI|nr:hypothetical protein Tsubulata_049849 [Turnera subulata]
MAPSSTFAMMMLVALVVVSSSMAQSPVQPPASAAPSPSPSTINPPPASAPANPPTVSQPTVDVSSPGRLSSTTPPPAKAPSPAKVKSDAVANKFAVAGTLAFGVFTAVLVGLILGNQHGDVHLLNGSAMTSSPLSSSWLIPSSRHPLLTIGVGLVIQMGLTRLNQCFTMAFVLGRPYFIVISLILQIHCAPFAPFQLSRLLIFSSTATPPGLFGTKICRWWGVQWCVPYDLASFFAQWFSLAGSSSSRSSWLTIFYATIWSIWLARNNLIFSSKSIDWERIFDIVLLGTITWIKANHPSFPYHFSNLLATVDSLKSWKGSKCHLSFT